MSTDNRTYLDHVFGLQGRTALVTGASGGIGRALAVGLAGAGAVVGLHGRRADELAETRKQVEAVGGRAVELPAELNDDAACRRLVADARAALGGRLDVLVNNAGMNRRKPIEQVPADDFETILNVNLRAPYVLSQAAHPVMREQGGGKIVHVASLTTFIGLGGTSVYGATKAAIAQLAKTQAVEWAKDNVQVNCLAPGFIRTPLTEQSVWGDDRRRAWLLGRIPAKRGGTPEDMVAAVLLMASPGSAYLTGQTIAVDGGVLAGGSWDD
ncbi:MAG: 3-oxoacyl-[acyl-carrier protein] reductase [uncultured Phycisphaerae bacterium]|uniref:3-oxoacyl-[acyl-carrier protein] reductase n=1 Tax=uncultured Phycisphaerae bacterium TaxID=904963 RepID=A0A6J4QQ89_9BACT|nr:MAG: 3-oxoacyl-[acyl-carrier protein] reductase [uncultured Phycisphaerae bacterium]